MNITSGKIQSAQKVVIYGPEGIGKSTFAAKFPNPLFSDTEGSTKHLDVRRFDRPETFEMFLAQAQYVKANPDICKTYVIDTADWLEKLCARSVCAKYKKTGIEDFGYGKGYVYLAEEFGRALNLLDDIVRLGVNVVFTAHANMRKFEQPDEAGAYDRWELKLGKHTAPMLKEWADAVFFVNYKTTVEKDKNNKYKATGGKRVMFCEHHSCWDAKNRYGLSAEKEFDFSVIAPFILGADKAAQSVPTAQPEQKADPVAELDKIVDNEPQAPAAVQADEPPEDGIPPQLWQLMRESCVTADDVKLVVEQEGYFPRDTEFKNYDDGFVEGWIIAFWDKVLERIHANNDLPFD